jgi:hypothetical protein
MPPITPRPRRLAAALALALASPLPAHADLAVGPDEAGPRIRVDGRLDEAAWAEAQVFEDFAVTQPYTLARPSTRTVVRLLSTPEGIAVGFDIEQPAAMPRLRPRLERDQRRPSDRVNVVIDFDADGRVAYDFAVLLSGSIQDDVITEERRFNPDWDGDWQWAVDEDAEGWRVEMLIPWTTATMRDANAPTREIAVYFDRVVGASEERHAFPAASFERARFVSDFQRITIPQHRAQLLRVFPYATLLQDLRGGGEPEAKAGVDLLWKPSAGFQLAATLNPDFGQVEADELVVNFDAVETYFSDKRPFFTENQGLFDLRTPDGGQLVYTRRIGGPADGGDGAADITGALKLTGALGGLGWGALAAEEADADGRGFGVLRLLGQATPTLGLGWLGTHVDRPALDRRAMVNAVDAQWRPSPSTLVSGQLLASDIDAAAGARRGTGGWVRADWAPAGDWRGTVEATRFGRALDFSDLGFQRRAGLDQLRGFGEWRQSGGLPEGVSLRRWQSTLLARANANGDRLPSSLDLVRTTDLADGRQWSAELGVTSSGVDDQISRGNGDWHRPARAWAWLDWRSSARGGVQWELEGGSYQEGLAGWAQQAAVEVSWTASDTLSLSLEGGVLRSRDWIVWRGGDRFARHRRSLREAALNLSWFPGRDHELRLKTQWLGLVATRGDAWRLDADGAMVPLGLAEDDFAVDSFGVQLRYRYAFDAQRELYLVWSRGGEAFSEGLDAANRGRFEDAIELVDADQLMAKLRWRF